MFFLNNFTTFAENTGKLFRFTTKNIINTAEAGLVATKLSNMKKILLLLITLVAGLTANAMRTETVTFKGMRVTVNNKIYNSWEVQSSWGQASLPNQQSTYSYYDFNNVSLNWSPVTVTLNGRIQFQESTTPTDFYTSTDFRVVFNSSELWFYGASVKTLDGTNVNSSSVSVSSDKHTVTVVIDRNHAFGQIVLTYVPNEPLSSSNTVIGGIEDEYIYYGSPVKPVPTVTSNGVTLTEGTDYTLSHSTCNAPGTGLVTVTGTGNYTGSVNKVYTIRNIAPSDFNSLGSDTYEIVGAEDGFL